MKKINLFTFIFIVFGFRTFYAENLWPTSNSTQANRKLFIIYDDASDSIKNDFVGTSDELSDDGSTITVETAVDSIMSDFNSIASAYVELVDSEDIDYSQSFASDRTISISFGGSAGTTTGHAQMEYVNGEVVGCKIALESSLKDSAKEFIQTLTHEIGHCLGLDHAQDTVNSIMSYYMDRDAIFRLQNDDKMGITYLFPSDVSKAKEVSTFGLSCTPKN